MKSYIFVIVLIPFLILTGCTYYDDDHAYDDHSSSPQTENMSNDPNTRNMNANPNHNTNNDTDYLRMKNATYNQIADNHNTRIQVADEIATELDEWNEIKRANVIIYNNNAFVSLVLGNGANQTLSNSLRQNVTQYIKNTDHDIENVYISANPDFVRELALLMNKINFQRENQEIMQQFNKTVRGEFSNVKF